MQERIKEARPGSIDNVINASVLLRYMAPPGHTLADVQRPDYWRQLTREAGQQRTAGRHAWNRLEVLAEDGTWEAEFRVVEVGDGLVHLRLLRQWPEKAALAAEVPAAPPPDGYRVEYVEHNGWRAIEPGGTMLIEKRPSRDEALRRAVEHARKARGAR